MAFCFPQSLVLLVLCLAILSGCCADLIGDVCSKTTNPSLCNQVLRSARQREPNLIALGKIAFSQAQDSIVKLQDNLGALSSATTDPELKRRLNICSQDANTASVKLSNSNNLFVAKNYANMLIEANGALSAEALCDSQFRTPPNEPVQLKQANGRAQDLTSIVAAIAKNLLEH